ncbi:GntP family permease [Novacetimonas maltaceti]|uniref:Uncharacterized protein n=1 Tax=Novacetimonas maltaceti TaxID=1203393 RepID=A0A2S3W1W3_9PROT|nr:GntP family permease [Novacetimonas maltaceti]POF62827.1 hypothetical protein KMAL_15500 [Novacetimonas maltaceti]
MSLTCAIVLIARFHLNALVVLFGVAIALMLAAGHGPMQAVASFQHGAGNALGSIRFRIAFGTMFGKPRGCFQAKRQRPKPFIFNVLFNIPGSPAMGVPIMFLFYDHIQKIYFYFI